jgi:hypothetical protein
VTNAAEHDFLWVLWFPPQIKLTTMI